jgi:hypothetical protein
MTQHTGPSLYDMGLVYRQMVVEEIENPKPQKKREEKIAASPSNVGSMYVGEAKKPNDGNLANNYPPYDKVTRGDVIAGATGKDEMGGKKKKKVAKEGYSNWRDDLREVMDNIAATKQIKEKKVKNKIIVNPPIKESVEEIGGTLIEMVEIDEIDFILESAYDELIEEGYDEDDIEEALEYALTEAKVTFGHDTPSTQKKKQGLLAAARKRLSGAKAAAKTAVARGARKVAKGALGVARKMEGGSNKSRTTERKPATYRGAGAGQKERVSSGSYQAPAKKKMEPIKDPWEGSATKPKAKAKPATKSAAPKAKAPVAKKKKKSNLDNLLASIRNEETRLDEKSLSQQQQKFMGMVYAVKKGEMKAPSPEVAKAASGMSKKQARDFAKTKHKGLPKKVEEQMGIGTETDKKKELLDRQKLANLRMIQQKKQQLDRQKLQMQKSGKLPLEAN